MSTALQWNLSKTATCESTLTDPSICSTEVDCNVLVLFGAREAGCFREVAAQLSYHLGQVPLCAQ